MESIAATFEQSRFIQKLSQLLWILLLIAIPFTSSPLVSWITGGSTVSPLAGIPLFFLFIIWYLPNLFRTRKISKVAVPLLIFFCVALLSTILAAFLEHYPFLGQDSLNRGIRALITLVVGIGFYLVFSKYPSTQSKMVRSLQWLYIGGFIMLLWATIQTFVVFRDASIPKNIWLLHRVFSNRDMLYTRVTGMAYEPSWLANLLVILYIPLWLSSVIQGFTVFPRRYKRISIELGLFIWGVVVLFLSLSRIGLISFMTVFGVLSLVGGWRLTGKIIVLKKDENSMASKQNAGVRQRLRLMLWVVLIFFCISIVSGVIVLASRLDPRVERIFQTDLNMIVRNSPTPLFELANRLSYAERVMFWTIGLRAYATHPVLGVGLGNTGFYFRDYAPAYSYLLPELVRTFIGTQEFPNPKNLWVRLLAETGIIGFSTFILWLFLIALCARFLLRTGNGVDVVIGLAVLLALIAQFWEGFSLDTFALPQFWMLPAFTTAMVLKRSNSVIRSPYVENGIT